MSTDKPEPKYKVGQWVIGWGNTAAVKSVEWSETAQSYVYKLQGLSDKTFLEAGFAPKAIAAEMKMTPDVEFDWLESNGEVVAPFLKTSGIGWGFTDNDFEAAVFSTEAEAKRVADRIKKQHLTHRIWEVLPCPKGFCIRVVSQKARRAGK